MTKTQQQRDGAEAKRLAAKWKMYHEEASPRGSGGLTGDEKATLFDWVLSVISDAADTHDSGEPVEESQATALGDELGSLDPWVGRLWVAALARGPSMTEADAAKGRARALADIIEEVERALAESVSEARRTPHMSTEDEGPVFDALCLLEGIEPELDALQVRLSLARRALETLSALNSPGGES